MSTKISIDGSILDQDEARISVLDRGFLYGDSVYEVIRTYAGSPFALEAHLERLGRSADLLGIGLPLDMAGFGGEIDATLEAAGNPESYIRVIITRGAGPIGLDPGLAEHPCRVIIVAPFSPHPEEMYEEGVSIILVSAGRSAGGAVPAGAKSGNYLVNLMALGAARRRGGHEAVLLDASGRVREGASSNIFVLKGTTLSTPPLSAGILEGITRHLVIDQARASGLRLEERHLWPDDLRRADEVFLTSTIREVLPVTSVDDQVIGDGRPGPMTRDLRAGYQRLTRS